MAENGTSKLDSITKTVQIVSVVVGVVISVLSFNYTRQKDADARMAEANKQEIEAAKPFLELRQKRYMEAIESAAILSSPETHSPDEMQKARKRFWELYWAELSMVEDAKVEGAMKKLGESLDPQLKPTSQQISAYELAHALRDSLTKSWGISENKEGKTNP